MPATVRSVNAGALRSIPGLRRASAIRKAPSSRIEVRQPGSRRDGLGSGVVGDEIGSRRHHGGDSKAVYAFAREELDHWSLDLGRPLTDGMFGENITTQGLAVDDALIGETWRVGATLLEVCGPRIPCATFAAHMGEPQWSRRFTARGRTGAYLAVVEAGVIEPGDPIEVAERPAHDLTVPTVFRAVMGDRELARRVLAAEVLWAEEHEWLARRA